MSVSKRAASDSFPERKPYANLLLPRRSPPSDNCPDKKVFLDPSLVGDLVIDISTKASSALSEDEGSVSEGEILAKDAFIEPYENVHLDHNSKRVEKVER